MSADQYYAMKRAAARRFEAKFPGRCPACDERIEVGDLLRWDDGAAVHADCDDAVPADAPTTEVCPRCCLAVAVNGECGCGA